MDPLTRIFTTAIGAVIGAIIGQQAAMGNLSPLIVAIALVAVVAAVWGVRAAQDANGDWDA